MSVCVASVMLPNKMVLHCQIEHAHTVHEVRVPRAPLAPNRQGGGALILRWSGPAEALFVTACQHGEVPELCPLCEVGA